jgi:hypothetical protein
LDQNGYVHWPNKAPDPQPLKLIKQGKRTEAYEYCLTHINGSTGEARSYYVVQASALAVRLKQPHVVAEKMAKAINAKAGRGPAGRNSVPDEEWLRYAFAVALSDFVSRPG